MFNATFWTFGIGSAYCATLSIISAIDGFAPVFGIPWWALFPGALVQWGICWFSGWMAERRGEWL